MVEKSLEYILPGEICSNNGTIGTVKPNKNYVNLT